ncbi:VacJ family lipoprotein [Bowmanella sp. JS7-9]|uniref:VacJ family lipoprotein n=2 Tax=Pseudobowmanella zhangzhouensis TaxID=1537679 RepID=A0ABW1XGP5_9ALTE|nr:VacJ family lipoprotein [Bowmanella sp. JS7-9]TBX25824.1 ABC transporter [Bowmanella sp. JS7-9]
MGVYWRSLPLILLLLGGCASRPHDDAELSNNPGDPRDPIESFNREMWDFNWNVLDKHILRPTTEAYITVMPRFARDGLYNAALNLEEPANAVNNLLQGKVGDSAGSVGRFVINSTIGLLGFFDVAKHMGIERTEEEFGETLGVWGVGTGPYLMVPAMGPNDPRNLTGDIVDGSYFPMADLNIYLSLLSTGIKVLEIRASLMEQEKLVEQSVDPYALVKDIYFQQQEFKVKDGKVEKPAEEKELEDDIDAYLDNL